MTTYRLIAKRGVDPADDQETFLVEMRDQDGTLIGAGAWVVDEQTTELTRTGREFEIALALGATYLAYIDDGVQAIVNAFEDAPVMWEHDSEGEIQNIDRDDVESEGGGL